MIDNNEAAANGCAFFGEGVTFKGSISVPEKIIIHGAVEGDIASRELLVGPTGVIKGNVRVDQADVQGKIFENIEARICLSLRKTGQIEGKAVYGEIEIEKGGVLSGEVCSISKTVAPETTAAQSRNGSDRLVDSRQLVSVDMPQLIASTRSETRLRSDAVRAEARSRVDGPTRPDGKRDKQEVGQMHDDALRS